MLVSAFALSGLALSFNPGHGSKESGHEDGHQDGHQDANQDMNQDGHQDEHHETQSGGQESHQSDFVQYHEDIPDVPLVRDMNQYLLNSSWDFHAQPTTREYHWTITDADLNPDGIYRPMMLINNQFPGPLVECNEGDTIIVNVDNHAVNATSIHFHGIFQNGTNFMDGTVGVTQCAIAPDILHLPFRRAWSVWHVLVSCAS